MVSASNIFTNASVDFAFAILASSFDFSAFSRSWWALFNAWGILYCVIFSIASLSNSKLEFLDKFCENDWQKTVNKINRQTVLIILKNLNYP